MEYGICSYSFHRLLAAGKQDIFKFIIDCKELGCSQLDPWNGHLTAIDEDSLTKIEAAADESGIPWGTLAVDGAHIYDADETVRPAHRAKAYKWLDVADKLGCEQVRIDAGGPEDMPDDAFTVIIDGYNDLIGRAKDKGIEIITENHFGPTRIPANVERLMQNIEGLGFLYDTNNWKPELRDEGRERCAKYATATHIKTKKWDEAGNEIASNIEHAVKCLKEAGYKGAWGIESVPEDGNEMDGCRKTIALLKRLVN